MWQSWSREGQQGGGLTQIRGHDRISSQCMLPPPNKTSPMFDKEPPASVGAPVH